MADSQVLFNYQNHAPTIQNSLTQMRLNKYISRAGYNNTERALQFYLWNSRISKSFQYVLNVIEVTLRNAISDHMLLGQAPRNWAFDTQYLDQLAQSLPDVRAKLNICKERLLYQRMNTRDFFQNVKNSQHIDIPDFGLIDTDDIIASLSFEFWVSMLGGNFEQQWQLSLRNVFPNAPKAETRKSIEGKVILIKNLRNRIAHHEPIFHLATLATLHSQMLQIIGYRCQATRDWCTHFSTVIDTINQNGNQNISDKLVKNYSEKINIINDNDTLITISKNMITLNAPISLYFNSGKYYSLSIIEISKIIANTHDVELLDTTTDAQNLIQHMKIEIVEYYDDKFTIHDALGRFLLRNVRKSQKPSLIIITDNGNHSGNILGCINKTMAQRAKM